nr:hypothetical protein [Tanacetum cinerariifolium]
MVLYGMVSDKYKLERATGIGLGLWSDLQTLITAREDRDASIIWDDQDQLEIRSWRFYALLAIHVLETEAKDIMYMFVDKKYPILPATIQRMLNYGLEIDRDPSDLLKVCRALTMSARVLNCLAFKLEAIVMAMMTCLKSSGVHYQCFTVECGLLCAKCKGFKVDQGASSFTFKISMLLLLLLAALHMTIFYWKLDNKQITIQFRGGLLGIIIPTASVFGSCCQFFISAGVLFLLLEYSVPAASSSLLLLVLHCCCFNDDCTSCDDFSPINVFEEISVTFSNPLFNSYDDFTSSDDESLSDKDVPEDNVKIYLNPLFKFDDEYISSDVNPLFDEVLEDIEYKDSYDYNLDESTFLVTPLFDSNEDEYFTPGDDVELLLHRDPSTPIMSIVSILEGFTNKPPLEENKDLFYLESRENEWKKILYDTPIDDLMIEDKIFNLENHDQIFFQLM